LSHCNTAHVASGRAGPKALCNKSGRVAIIASQQPVRGVPACDAGAQRNYRTEDIGSVVALTDENEQITDRYACAPFGLPRGREGATVQPFTYVGGPGVLAEDDGLYLMRARFYDPDPGRFLGKDPLEGALMDPHELHPYVYGLNVPTRLIDAWGLSPGECCPSGRWIFSGFSKSWWGMAFFVAGGYDDCTWVARCADRPSAGMTGQTSCSWLGVGVSIGGGFACGACHGELFGLTDPRPATLSGSVGATGGAIAGLGASVGIGFDVTIGFGGGHPRKQTGEWVLASASRSLPMICSGVCFFVFIPRTPFPGPDGAQS
jgi:RHS repeat-associated protein